MYIYIRLRRISNLVRLGEGGGEGERKGERESSKVVNPSPLYEGYIQYGRIYISDCFKVRDSEEDLIE